MPPQLVCVSLKYFSQIELIDRNFLSEPSTL